ncbi:glycosyltransferase family 25 protein [Pelomonas sp. V22]|uniref:glycosyltransferase family 25 protein n=1 Tax=Pelomonas sp. V22 TaxID=2822139 RepID=UPI0024A9DC1B|nr:glycosyltransferase family 25 protein [Pelomonas sp. V22]MDI4631846.1 glycosyltransferase family 25 protein [Pelomonas sp. V22]
MLPILYVNLDRDAVRRQRMEAEFAGLGLAAERFPATLWTALTDAEQSRYYSPELNTQRFHKPLVNGEKGCYASHLRAWQWLLDSPHAALVVLEDDVKLKPEFGAVVEAIAALPAGWDMVKLLGRPATGKREKLRGQRPLTASSQLVDYARIPSLTAGYVISRSGAEKLVKSRLPFGRPIDVDLRHFWENGLVIQGIEPAAIELDETSFESSIGDKPKGGLAARWRKFRHKAAYSFLNRLHSR